MYRHNVKKWHCFADEAPEPHPTVKCTFSVIWCDQKPIFKAIGFAVQLVQHLITVAGNPLPAFL